MTAQAASWAMHPPSCNRRQPATNEPTPASIECTKSPSQTIWGVRAMPTPVQGVGGTTRRAANRKRKQTPAGTPLRAHARPPLLGSHAGLPSSQPTENERQARTSGTRSSRQRSEAFVWRATCHSRLQVASACVRGNSWVPWYPKRALPYREGKQVWGSCPGTQVARAAGPVHAVPSPM